MAEKLRSKLINLNVGVLGHVDSGKTSLAKCISTVASTASFDKNPQSKERGITIDLGFSSFAIPVPDSFRQRHNERLEGVEMLQFTLVDCPGHASLIKTIIGGASIIDAMILVIDVMKGIQTQTAECLVIGEITCDKMIVVLNKIDLIAVDKRTAHIEKMTKRIHKTLESTKFRDCAVIAVSARPDGNEDSEPIGVQELLDALCKSIDLPVRSAAGPFLFAIDHCFSIRGQGTVMTGTVIEGSVRVNDTIEIPALKVTKKVKSMQMFKKTVTEAIQGDRIGICVTQFDPKLIERGVAATPNHLRQAFALIARVQRINYFKGNCRSKAKFHLSLMHETVMCKASFFTTASASTVTEFSFDSEYEWCDELPETGTGDKLVYCLLELEKPITVSNNSLLIASKLDTDINANVCRLAFHGNVAHLYYSKDFKPEFTQLKVFKFKSKVGAVERVVNDYELIAKSMFKKEFNVQKIEGFKVRLETGDEGKIAGSFGQSGKFKIAFATGLANPSAVVKGSVATLTFKKFVFDKSIRQ